MKQLIIIIQLFIIILMSNCSKEEQIDTIYPEIDISAKDAFPKQCSEIKRGTSFIVKVELRDNVALGSIGIDIHHNFDQHSHSTEVNSCALTATQATSSNTFMFMKSYPIPEGLKYYQTSISIDIPPNTDVGDYHFMIKVTDKSGWQTLKGLSIKIIE